MAKIKSFGYTLIELVVVVGLVSILSVGLVSIFSASIKGSSKARVEAEVKSQGDYAITLMERSLRVAATAPVCDPVSSYYVNYEVRSESGGLVSKSFSYDPDLAQILNETGSSLFGEDVTVTEAAFTCQGAGTFGLGSVSVSFSLQARGNMNQVVDQVFKTTVAVRSIQ